MEADLQRFYSLDYRDFYRCGGGESRLTLRRLLVLVAALPEESQFKSAWEDRDPISVTTAAVLDIWGALMQKPHPKWSAKQRRRERAEREELKASLLDEARRFNAAAMNKHRKEP